MRLPIRFILPLLVVALGACGQNIFKSAVTAKSDKARMAEARVQLDEGNYQQASKALEGMQGDSNDRRLLMVAALLGESGFVLWDQIVSIIDNASSDSNTSSVDQYFNTLSDAIFGVGDARTARLQALGSGLEVLAGSPDPAARRVNNLRCFVAAVLSAPTVNDGRAAINSVNQVLASVKDQATGSGDSAAECPNVTQLATALTTVASLRTQFDAILDSVGDCPFIDLSSTTGDLNNIESKLNQLTSAADKGCQEVPPCTAGALCDALNLGCVKAVLTDSGIAGDGVISTCEMVQNCTNPTDCFAL